eukprot:15443928-Alexandrium_andersonii.AAC.1
MTTATARDRVASRQECRVSEGVGCGRTLFMAHLFFDCLTCLRLFWATKAIGRRAWARWSPPRPPPYRLTC